MSECYVYVIGFVFNGEPSQPTKVGVSASPYGRLLALQTASPYELALVHAFRFSDRNNALEFEKTTHEFYERDRLRGEWINLGPMEVIDFMSFELDRRPRTCDLASREKAIAMLAGEA